MVLEPLQSRHYWLGHLNASLKPDWCRSLCPSPGAVTTSIGTVHTLSVAIYTLPGDRLCLQLPESPWGASNGKGVFSTEDHMCVVNSLLYELGALRVAA